MNIFYRLLLVAVVCTSTLTWCKGDRKWPWQRENNGISHENKVLRKHVGDRIEIELERGKRDYTWHIVQEPNPDMLQLHETDRPKTTFGFSNYEWEYDAIAPGTTWITFEQRDPNGDVVAKKKI